MRQGSLENSPVTFEGNSVILAYDHGLEHGPSDFEEVPESADPRRIFEIARHDAVTALAVQKGVAETYYEDYQDEVNLVLKLNGNSDLQHQSPYSPKNCTVKYAVEELDADAVGYTLYDGSRHEPEMFEDFRKVQEEARKYGVPVIVWAYPRGEWIEDDTDPEIIQYGARITLELGADMAKIKYPGSREAMEEINNLTGEMSFVMSGGSKTSDEEFLSQVHQVVDSGGNGVAVGRNVWQREEPGKILDKLQKVVFDSKQVEEVL